MTLPNFLVIGAAKAGSTSLYNYLRSHPQIFMSSIKEPRFFADSSDYEAGMDWYKSLFDEARPHHVARGEASVQYADHPNHPGVPARIAAVLGPVKLIYLVRHPIQRMISHYRDSASNGLELPPPEEAFLNTPEFINASLYAMQLEQYLPHFPLESVLIVTSEALRHERQRTLARVFRHLGVEPDLSIEAFGAEHNRADQRRVQRPVAVRLRRLPAYRRATRAIPTSLKVALDNRFNIVTRRVNIDITLSPSVLAELEARIRPDVMRLKTYLDPSFDGWGLI